jgi:hypothetical protein
MRYRLGLMLAIVVLGLVGLCESEAACRAAGEYRVTGPNSSGFLTLKETGSDASSSSGTVDLALYPRGGCPLCDFGGRIVTGKYDIALNFDGSCFLILRVFDPVPSQSGETGGTLAFGGAVIFFEAYSNDVYPLTPRSPDFNLTLGIRTDSLLRP